MLRVGGELPGYSPSSISVLSLCGQHRPQKLMSTPATADGPALTCFPASLKGPLPLTSQKRAHVSQAGPSLGTPPVPSCFRKHIILQFWQFSVFSCNKIEEGLWTGQLISHFMTGHCVARALNCPEEATVASGARGPFVRICLFM